jgi:hypothetical protein
LPERNCKGHVEDLRGEIAAYEDANDRLEQVVFMYRTDSNEMRARIEELEACVQEGT